MADVKTLRKQGMKRAAERDFRNSPEKTLRISNEVCTERHLNKQETYTNNTTFTSFRATFAGSGRETLVKVTTCVFVFVPEY